MYLELGMWVDRGNRIKEVWIFKDLLAEEYCLTNRAYILNWKAAQIVEDVRDLLIDTRFADVLMDMVEILSKHKKLKDQFVSYLYLLSTQHLRKHFITHK